MEEIEGEGNDGIYDEYYSPYSDTLESTYIVTVVPDMTNVTLKNNSQTKYIEQSIWGYYDIPSYTFSLNSNIVLNEDNPGDLYFDALNEIAEHVGDSFENPISLSLLCLRREISIREKEKIYVLFNLY